MNFLSFSKRLTFAILFFWASLSVVAAQTETAHSLFNGKNLDGWHADVPILDKDKTATSPFIVRDGMLVSLGEPRGHLITDAVHKNYKLEVEYRFAGKPGNCGVLVHASTPRALYKMFPQSLEVQMKHKNAGDFWCIQEDITVPNMVERRGPKENWGTSGRKGRRILNLTDDSENELGAWNTMTIECVADQIKVWVNGDLVNHGTQCTAQKGQIAIQAEGSEVEFRKLEITPMTTITKSIPTPESKQQQIFELRSYTLVNREAEAKLDAYLEHALIPALVRQGLGPIGVFDQADDESDTVEVLLFVAGPDTETVTNAGAKLAEDEQYQTAAADYLETAYKKPIIERIRSELLVAFKCWPQAEVPQQKTADKPRLFELRVYESATEQAGITKVDMFNSGEVPIFLACGITPVFMGQALIGDKMPNLTYMTVYDDDATRGAAWKKFVDHPDWHKLKVIPKYKHTVSKIHKSDWKPKSYSQL